MMPWDSCACKSLFLINLVKRAGNALYVPRIARQFRKFSYMAYQTGGESGIRTRGTLL